MKKKSFNQKFLLHSSGNQRPAISDENLQLEFKATIEPRQAFKRLYKFYLDKNLEETPPN